MAAHPQIIHFGRIKNCKKIYYNPELYLKQLQQLDGKEFEEIIKEKHIKPSTSTHGYYRGGIISTCLVSEKFGGWTEDEVHKYFTNKFLKTVIEKVFESTGDIIELFYIRSTSELTQKEMNDYIEQVVADLTFEGIEVLSPDEYNLQKYRIIKK